MYAFPPLPPNLNIKECQCAYAQVYICTEATKRPAQTTRVALKHQRLTEIPANHTTQHCLQDIMYTHNNEAPH